MQKNFPHALSTKLGSGEHCYNYLVKILRLQPQYSRSKQKTVRKINSSIIAKIIPPLKKKIKFKRIRNAALDKYYKMVNACAMNQTISFQAEMIAYAILDS